MFESNEVQLEGAASPCHITPSTIRIRRTHSKAYQNIKIESQKKIEAGDTVR